MEDSLGEYQEVTARKLQQVHAGHKSTRPSAVRKEDDELTQGPEEVLQR